MAYPFVPNKNTYERNWAFWKGAFNVVEMNRIIEIGENSGLNRATVGSEENSPGIRESYVSWIKVSEESRWIYEKLTDVVMKLNNDYFGFKLWGFGEDIQYTVYDASRGSEHYGWHVDSNGKDKPARRLSITMQLSNPQEYEGGELWIWNMTQEVMQKEQGLIFAFPSYVLHRVTPVTNGIRRSLVAWITGFE
jgi:PKHD-type hydroxylase